MPSPRLLVQGPKFLVQGPDFQSKLQNPCPRSRFLIQGPEFLSKVQNPNPSPQQLVQAPNSSSKHPISFQGATCGVRAQWGQDPPLIEMISTILHHLDLPMRVGFPHLAQAHCNDALRVNEMEEMVNRSVPALLDSPMGQVYGGFPVERKPRIWPR